MSKKKSKPPYKIALHEAGHAIVGLAVGYALANVHIDPSTEHGITNLAWFEGDGQGDDPICGGMVAWAGSVAEGVNYIVEDGDGEAFKRYRFCNRSVVTLRNMAEALVQKYRKAIEEVANVLVVKRTMSGAEVKRIAFKACPELRRDARPTPRHIAAAIKDWPTGEDQVPAPHKDLRVKVPTKKARRGKA